MYQVLSWDIVLCFIKWDSRTRSSCGMYYRMINNQLPYSVSEHKCLITINVQITPTASGI